MASINVTAAQLTQVETLLKTKKASEILRDNPELADALDKTIAKRPGRGSGASVPLERTKAVDF